MEIYAKMFVDLAAQSARRDGQGQALADTRAEQAERVVHAAVVHNNKERGTRRKQGIDPAIEHIVERDAACGDNDNKVDARGEKHTIELALAVRHDNDTSVALDDRGDIQSQCAVVGKDDDTRLSDEIFHNGRPIAKSVPESKTAHGQGRMCVKR